jgi:hypothetical protein
VSEIDLTNMSLLASTLLGGSGDPALPNSGQDVLSDIAVKDGRIYVVGMTNSPNLPLVSPIQTELRTSTDLMANIGATYDFLVASFDTNLTTLEFSTYLGGSGQESGAYFLPDRSGTFGGPVVAVSEDGLIHVAGDTYSQDFPVKGSNAGTYGGDPNADQGAASQGDAVVLTIAQPPTVFGQTNHVGVGFPFNGIVASFDNTRPNASPADFTATIDWGDGTSSAGEVTIDSNLLTKFDVSGTHTYDKIGTFPAVVRVTDTKSAINPQTAIDASNFPGSQFGPTIALDPSVPDRLFAAAVDEKGADAAQAGTGGGLFVSTSIDGGGTWSPRHIAVDENGEPLPAAFGGPKAVFDGFGNLFLTYVGAAGNDIVLALSTDGGLTFTKVADLVPEGSTPSKDANGDVVLSVDRPSVAVGGNSVWVTYQDVFDGAVVAAGASVTGLGQVGELSDFVIPSASGRVGDIAVGPQGQVVVLWQQPDQSNDKTINVFTSLKPDGLGPGPFSAPRLLTTTSIANTALDFVPSQPDFTLAWDPKGGDMGRLYVAYTQPTPQPNDPNLSDIAIYLRASDDAGTAWQAPVKVSDGPPGSLQFLPSIAIDAHTGTVGVGWYESGTGDGSAGVGDSSQAEYFVATSGDRGATFSAGQPVSAGPSKVGAGDGYGEYSGLAFYDGVLHPVWTDNSAGLLGNQDPPNTEIATAVIGVMNVGQGLAVEGQTISGVEGTTLSVPVAQFTDPAGPADVSRYSATIHWGDGADSNGTITKNDNGDGFTVSGDHQFATPGHYSVRVEITGPSAGGQATIDANIADAALDVKVSDDLNVVRETKKDITVATLTDQNTSTKDTDYIATIQWGDGTTSVGTLKLKDGSGTNGAPNTFEISGNHSYLEGTSTVKVSVLDRASGKVVEDSGI